VYAVIARPPKAGEAISNALASMIFKDPWLLVLLPLFFVLAVIKARKGARQGFFFPSNVVVKELKHSARIALYHGLYAVRVLCVVLVIAAIARPQISMGAKAKKEGIAVIVAIDSSSTMLAEDYKIGLADLVRLPKEETEGKKRLSRIDAARNVARDFIRSRPDDLIGLVAFGAEAFIVCPLTFDHDWLLRSLERVKVGLIKDGTAIGSGILSGLNSLKDVKAKSRIIVLLTDGVNNFGQVSPMTAANAARALGVKIYTVGVVSDGHVLYPVKDEYGRETFKEVIIEINEDALKKIANTTGGDYFRATDMGSLRNAYDEINRLEKVEISEKEREDYRDVFGFFVFPALALLLVEEFLRNTFLRKIP